MDKNALIRYIQGELNKCTWHQNVVILDKCKVEEALELLKQPTLPREASKEMLAIIKEAWGTSDLDSVYDKMYAHLTAPPKPKTKKIKVWRVEWKHNSPQIKPGHDLCMRPFIKLVEANEFKIGLEDAGHECINIIEGDQEVPDNG